MAEFIIHRGTHQIGGMCAEIRTKKSRIIIDMGAELPSDDEEANYRSDEALVSKVFSVSRKPYAVLFTHYHGDHIGLMERIPDDIPMYMGKVAIQLAMNVAARTDKLLSGNMTAVLDRVIPYPVGRPFAINDIKVTPFQIGHSALDSYMLLIEADGKRLLYTGDFRDHGIMCSQQTFRKVVEMYIGKVDVLVTEGTMLSRSAKTPMSEYELYERAKRVFSSNKYNFVLVSSMNLDSIMSFIHAAPDDKEFVCDKYQLSQILTASHAFGTRHGGRYKMYNVPRFLTNSDGADFGNKTDELRKKGFVMLVRTSDKFKDIIERFDRSESCFIYSMWEGYLERDKPYTNQRLIDMMSGYKVEKLHTSGHAGVECIRELIAMTDPAVIIPMHSEKTDEMSEFEEFIQYNSRFRPLADGQIFDIDSI